MMQHNAAQARPAESFSGARSVDDTTSPVENALPPGAETVPQKKGEIECLPRENIEGEGHPIATTAEKDRTLHSQKTPLDPTRSLHDTTLFHFSTWLWPHVSIASEEEEENEDPKPLNARFLFLLVDFYFCVLQGRLRAHTITSNNSYKCPIPKRIHAIQGTLDQETGPKHLIGPLRTVQCGHSDAREYLLARSDEFFSVYLVRCQVRVFDTPSPLLTDRGLLCSTEYAYPACCESQLVFPAGRAQVKLPCLSSTGTDGKMSTMVCTPT